MHTLPYEIDCKWCGCPDVEVERAPNPKAWFADGVARCNECGGAFHFQGKEEPEETAGKAVIFHRLQCPKCGSCDVPVQRTAPPVRYHKCRTCGETFKSVEKT